MADLSQLSDAALMSALGNSPAGGLQGMSDAALLQALGQAPAQDVNSLGDIAKSGGIGLAKGVIGLAGLPGDVADLASKGYDYLTGSKSNDTVGPYARTIGAENIQKHIENYTGKFYQPKTTAGQYAQTVGEFAPAVLGGPESLATRFATRVAAPALASEAAGQATQGTAFEPYARVLGAVGGAGLPVAASRAISPTTVDAANAAAVNTLKNEGVTALTAGQKSGSRVMKYMESELGDSLGAGNSATTANELAHEQFTQAALRRAGIDAPRATPEVMDQAFSANSNLFDSVAARNPAIPIPQTFFQDAEKIANDYAKVKDTRSGLLDDIVERLKGGASEVPPTAWPEKFHPLVAQLKQQGINDADIAKTLGISVPKAAASGVISGEAYQTIQSEMARFGRAANNNPELKIALGDLRSSLNDAIGKGLEAIGNKADLSAWNAARGQYKNLLVLERASTGTSELASKGLITPAALATADKAVAGRRAVARGTSDYADLARAGNAVMKPLPQSGTAPRAAAHLLPSLVGAGLGAGLGGIGSAALGVAAPALLGRAIMSPLVQRYLSNQAAVPLRQIPTTRNAIAGGVLALPGSR